MSGETTPHLSFGGFDEDDEPTQLAGIDLPDGMELVGRLGEGGMGEVFLVRDRALGRELALKTIRSRRWREIHAERFEREARTTANLQHPGIIAIHGYGTLPDGRPWFTMPAIRGRELAHLLADRKRSGAPDLRAIIRILRRAAEPLAYAHVRGVVHRDVKPTNIMLGEHGEVLVLDWGLARPSDAMDVPHPGLPESVDSPSLTRTGALLGTPIYMAPEQVGYGRITPRTDVYALGAVLYEVLQGHPPRRGEVKDVLAATLGGRPFRRPEGPPALVDLALDCLAHEPEERPANAAEVGETL
ncbi:MAG: serine/threonine protein kinase, partial [Myxococcales bacterium]|nr:serine/threonine protein kinase [Myxococcales bacterium]